MNSRPKRVRRVVTTLLVLYVAVSAALLMTVLGMFRLTETVNSTTLRHEIGHAYYWPWASTTLGAVPGDTPEAPMRSRVNLYENGRRLGPPHSQHVDIREFGRGRYSHWGTGIYFSASDNSDPGHNGRRYTVRYATSPGRWAISGWLALTALPLGILTRAMWRRRVKALQAARKVLVRVRENWASFE